MQLSEAAATRIVARGRVRSLELTRSSSGLSLMLLIVEGLAERRLSFQGVRDLRFRGETTQLLEFVVLQVEDISSRGWEDCRFSVGDAEEDFVSFFCASVEV